MPLPIKPVHSLDLHAEIFDTPSMEGLGLSDIQIQLLGVPQKTQQKEASKLGQKYIDLLKSIDQSVDEVVTAASALTLNKEAKVCNVPDEINDNDLLALKTAGLLTGYGRSVTLTDRAKLALRDYYLSQETVNEFRKSRTKDKFDYNEAKTVSANGKFKKIATWLNKDEFQGEFDVRFVADTDEKRVKGLMFADPLDDFEIVFFKFPRKGQHGFWNKNVEFSLSLAFLDDDFEIIDFKDLEKQSTKLVSPKSDDVKYVVEAKKGIFEKLGISLGDKLILKGKNLILDKKT